MVDDLIYFKAPGHKMAFPGFVPVILLSLFQTIINLHISYLCASLLQACHVTSHIARQELLTIHELCDVFGLYNVACVRNFVVLFKYCFE